MFGEARIWFAVGMVLRGWIQAVGWIGRLRGGRRGLGGVGPFSPGGTCGLGRVRRLEGESSLIAHFSVVAVVCGGAPVSLLSGRGDRLASVYVGAICVASSRGPKQPVSLMTAYSPGRGKSMELGIC